jgi:hypothetical protein
MYKKISYKDGNNSLVEMENIIFRISDNTFIPFDPNNKDYQAYLKWLAEGNTPEPAENT